MKQCSIFYALGNENMDSVTEIETISTGNDATGDRGILFDQRLGHTFD